MCLTRIEDTLQPFYKLYILIVAWDNLYYLINSVFCCMQPIRDFDDVLCSHQVESSSTFAITSVLALTLTLQCIIVFH